MNSRNRGFAVMLPPKAEKPKEVTKFRQALAFRFLKYKFQFSFIVNKEKE